MSERLEAYPPASDKYVTGTGQILSRVHPETSDCHAYGCVIHHPTDPHPNWPTHWRSDRGIMERICPHGVGHPDVDQMRYIRRTHGAQVAKYEGIHGCDGCCRRPPEPAPEQAPEHPPYTPTGDVSPVRLPGV